MFMLRLKAIGSAIAGPARNAGNVIRADVKFIAAKLLALWRIVRETFVGPFGVYSSRKWRHRLRC